jgi:hypothetical protein
VLNNPIRHNDPSGHVCSDPEDRDGGCEAGGNFITKKDIKNHSIAYRIKTKYKNVTIKDIRDWNTADLQDIYVGLTELSGNGFSGNAFTFRVIRGCL